MSKSIYVYKNADGDIAIGNREYISKKANVSLSTICRHLKGSSKCEKPNGSYIAKLDGFEVKAK